MSSVAIKPLTHTNFPDWLPLWNANNLGIVNETVTTETWARICDTDSPVHGLGAFDGDTLVGLVHYILHPTTGAIEPVCYMQDVFVTPEHRKLGIARKLIAHLANIGKREKWARMYWLAESKNTAAQNLYKSLGVKMDFTLHILPLSN
jgi:GNAT superfamily N-acetyltransferase